MPKKKLKLEVVAKTNTGMVREANEDNFVVTPDSYSADWILPKGEYDNSEGGTIMVIADGMGGLNAGEVASNIAVDSIKTHISKAGPVRTDTMIVGIMRDAILQANTDITRHSQAHEETQGMGSTLVMAWVNKVQVHLSWVGDSRCYLWRNNQLEQLSKDHSYVQSLVDEGRLTTEQAFYHPENNVILQSLGEGERKPKPDYSAMTLADKDIILLCSDGLNSMLQDDQIASIITGADNLPACADQLIDAANTAGGSDNITVILAKVISGAPADALTDKETADEQKKKKKGRRLIYGLATLIVLAAASFFGRPMLINTFHQQRDSTVVKKTDDTTKKAPLPHKTVPSVNHVPVDTPAPNGLHPPLKAVQQRLPIHLPAAKPASKKGDSITLNRILPDTPITENQQ